VGFARRRHQDVETFLAEIDSLRQSGVHSEGDRLLITSIHRAKGLEWPLVILPGLEDGTVPYRLEDDDEGGEEIEDERRLMYVGMTRAIEQLYLLYPEDRRFEKKNKTGDCRCPPSTDEGRFPASCFLYEANLQLSDQLGGLIVKPDAETEPVQALSIQTSQRYLQAIESKVTIEQKNTSRSTSILKTRKKPKWLGVKQLKKGVMVKHKTFGTGTVRSVSSNRDVVTVEFPSSGLQNMVINLAKLRPAE
jgi:DNA helicase-2/ATP-dependent DNA helicase PcrA